MKTQIVIITTLLLSMTSIVLAQLPPITPDPPIVVSVHHDDHGNNSSSNSNTSISISSTDESYSFRAKHSGEKDAELLELLKKELGTANLTKSGNYHNWIVNSNNEEVYEVKFKDGYLKMDIDKSIASPDLVKKIEAIGKSARTIITGKSEANRDAERLQREADRMQRSADRMRREALRMQESAQLNANRIKIEAERLEQEAERAERDARHGGGVSTIIKQLLKNRNTYFDGDDQNNNWVWPSLQKELLANLKSDGLISSETEVSLTKDDLGIYINGNKLTTSQEREYLRLFSKHKITSNLYFSYNKYKNNIVIVDDKVELESLVTALHKNGFISSVNKKNLFKINGNSAFRNGEELSKKEVSELNQFLLKYYVIPAPGKILEIVSKGTYRVGYAVDDRTHLGTWHMEN